MALSITPSTKQERKLLFLRTVLNSTDKVSKIADEAILSAIGNGVAAVSGKAEKDIVLALSNLYPDNTYGDKLDNCAEIYGVPKRFGASQSSTFVRIVADPGTQYLQGTHIFSTTSGVQFELEKDITIDTIGFTYAKVRSIDSGLQTNVDPASINRVSPQPSGHLYVINEYIATGGRDQEQDDIYRQRIKEGANILAKSTLSMLDQVFMKINNNFLKTFYQGYDENGRLKLGIVSQNGIDFNLTEINNLIDQGDQYFSIIELKQYARKFSGIVFSNITWQYLDMSFRCELLPNYNIDDVRKNIQINIAKYLDFRFWQPGDQKIEWDNLLEIVKSTKGVKYVADEWFYPRVDIAVDKTKLPRLRGFLMLNLNGGLIRTTNSALTHVFYPNAADFTYQSTVLRSII